MKKTQVGKAMGLSKGRISHCIYLLSQIFQCKLKTIRLASVNNHSLDGLLSFLCCYLQMRSKYISSITSCSIIVPDLATGQRPVSEHVEDNGCESCPSSKQIDNELVESNQNNEPSESCQTFEKDTGKQVQSLSNDMEHESCNFKDTHIDIPQTSTSDTSDKSMSEINNLKHVDCMEGASSTLSKQDTNFKLGAVSEDTAQSNQSESLCNDSVALSTIRKGTEIQLRGLNLEENVSTLRGGRVVFTLECKRCRQRIDQQLSVSGYVYNTTTTCQVWGLHGTIFTWWETRCK